LAGQDEDEQLKKIFGQVAQSLEENREKILKELLQKQGTGENLGGYYLPDSDTVSSLMRPCETFNSILASLSDR
ncbi:MAG: NADP-dependent isocitrate dehydrogenase, partial [Sphaerochaetaceae bacterium]|nr:NADP-dependent isocitrate dehydrogenase [Sphaerochaetaceae bacterium]